MKFEDARILDMASPPKTADSITPSLGEASPKTMVVRTRARGTTAVGCYVRAKREPHTLLALSQRSQA